MTHQLMCHLLVVIPGNCPCRQLTALKWTWHMFVPRAGAGQFLTQWIAVCHVQSQPCPRVFHTPSPQVLAVQAPPRRKYRSFQQALFGSQMRATQHGQVPAPKMMLQGLMQEGWPQELHKRPSSGAMLPALPARPPLCRACVHLSCSFSTSREALIRTALALLHRLHPAAVACRWTMLVANLQ